VRVAPVNDVRAAVSLEAAGDRQSFSGHVRLATGRHRLRIVVADAARNETEREIDVEVPASLVEGAQ
jgi:hypothetical protein